MSGDLFTEHGLHGLHEWPEAQDAALALLAARRKACQSDEAEAGGASAPSNGEESRLVRDS